LACWIINYSTFSQKHDALFLGAIFLLGRVIFLVSYAFGILIGLPSLRGYGMCLTYAPTLILALRIIGKPVF
jgi:uncharacterized membrane protein YecN with MAPEG domain